MPELSSPRGSSPLSWRRRHLPITAGSWAEADQIELTGTVKKVVIAPPHPTIDLTATDGVDWHIELGNPRQTERSGFNAKSTKPGDTIIVLGNRSLDPEEKRLKAVKVTVGEKVYEIYPDRIKRN